jgi:hypothetical protein
MTHPAPHVEFPLTKFNAALRQAQILYASMASSLIAYFVVSRFLPDRAPVANVLTFQMIAFALAIAMVFVSVVIKGVMLRNAPAGVDARLNRLRVVTIVLGAFAEMPAILGFVLVLLTGEDRGFAGLIGVSAYLFIRHFPRRGSWENYVRRGSDIR